MKYSEFVGYEASERCDALLSVQYLKLSLRGLIEVDKSEWITFEQGVDNSHIFLAVVVDVMALVFGLYGEFTIEAKQTFALVFVVDEPLAKVAHSPVCMKCWYHCFFRIKIRA